MTKKKEEELSTKLKNETVLNDSELAELRILNDLDENDTFNLCVYIWKQNREEESFTFEEMEEFLYQSCGKKFLKTFLLERALRFHKKYFGGERMDLENWLLFIAMLTKCHWQDRHALVFEILDRREQDVITLDQLSKYIHYAVEMGWAFDPKLIDQCKTIPPEFEVRDLDLVLLELSQQIKDWSPAQLIPPKTKWQKVADFMGYQPKEKSIKKEGESPSPNEEDFQKHTEKGEESMKQEKNWKEKANEYWIELLSHSPFHKKAHEELKETKEELEQEIAKEYLVDPPYVLSQESNQPQDSINQSDHQGSDLSSESLSNNNLGPSGAKDDSFVNEDKKGENNHSSDELHALLQASETPTSEVEHHEENKSMHDLLVEAEAQFTENKLDESSTKNEELTLHDLLEATQEKVEEKAKEEEPKSMHDLLEEARVLTTRVKRNEKEGALSVEEKDKFHADKLQQMANGMTLTKFVHMPFTFR
eukprot:TRINITY_DN4477_c0_g1_i2.p1 TRINITY_DN4477_c0_g1~~TRINITY_DN4477_c0_g1_i2.p1  ORF type:complete len:478 (+),score=167.33 TRINITY_DN4477_c0_g1_i2:531-1964(+)